MMDKADLLNKILSSACPNTRNESEGTVTFTIQTHCVSWEIVANCGIWDVEKDYATYEIVSATPIDT